ncbi:hypothetical protein [Nocardia sp. XZ_19_385]|uniref:hypothetical protein n=1 Tax=Nocardia sp. XZ_19_385 TaxID=2769488 RepID=UPI00188FCE10|nr:hypothetical protein [Nocardia sp. XZ_19_385]
MARNTRSANALAAERASPTTGEGCPAASFRIRGEIARRSAAQGTSRTTGGSTQAASTSTRRRGPQPQFRRGGS